MKIAQRDIPTASPSRPSRGIARSRGEALFRARVARRSVGDAVRRTLSGPVGQDTLIASLLTTASLVGLLVHLHVDLPEGGTDVVERPARHTGDRPCAPADRSARLATRGARSWSSRSAASPCSCSSSSATCPRSPRSVSSWRCTRSRHTVNAGSRSRPPSGAPSVVLMILVGSREPLELDAIFAESLVVGAVWFIGDGLRTKRSQVSTSRTGRPDSSVNARRRHSRRLRRSAVLIARELHDMVAHNVSVIVAQSAAAQRVFDAYSRRRAGRVALDRGCGSRGARGDAQAARALEDGPMTGPMCGTRSRAWTTSRPSCRRFGRPDFTSVSRSRARRDPCPPDSTSRRSASSRRRSPTC